MSSCFIQSCYLPDNYISDEICSVNQILLHYTIGFSEVIFLKILLIRLLSVINRNSCFILLFRGEIPPRRGRSPSSHKLGRAVALASALKGFGYGTLSGQSKGSQYRPSPIILQSEPDQGEARPTGRPSLCEEGERPRRGGGIPLQTKNESLLCRYLFLFFIILFALLDLVLKINLHLPHRLDPIDWSRKKKPAK
ncbi:hypothetical protein MNBD_ALPHA01-1901 [hydrothermal vent metagenome]|uniref:Uncharacterized protein n=1 Tax=hydrothermal vent metagenome TaxID=652676 RepID=A0A3B0SKX0_9ZZZZ